MSYIEYLKAVRKVAHRNMVFHSFRGLCRIQSHDIQKEEQADYRRLRELLCAHTWEIGYQYLDENRKWRWSLGYHLPLWMYGKQARMAMRVKWLDQLIAKEEENV